MKRATYLVTELLKIFLLFSIPGSIICFASAAVEHDLAAALPLLPLWLIPLLLVFVRQYVKNFFLFALATWCGLDIYSFPLRSSQSFWPART